MTLDGPDQLQVADITYVAIAVGFIYVAVILDAWSRRVVGYAISRSINARLTIAALKAAIERRKPPPSCVHHSDRGSQYAAERCRDTLTAHSLVGWMGRRGNPYVNAKAENFMKTMKVETVYPMAYETFNDAVENLPRIIDEAPIDRRVVSLFRLGRWPSSGWQSPGQTIFKPSRSAPTCTVTSESLNAILARMRDSALRKTQSRVDEQCLPVDARPF
jgi:transposase InsO family protein